MQVKRTLKLTTFILPFCVSSTFMLLPIIGQAAEVRNHYKCYVQLQDESKRVTGFVTNEPTKAKFVEKLPGKKVFNPDGETGSNIIHIYECVNANTQFTLKEALTLEAQTPR